MSLISGLQLNPKLPLETQAAFADLYEKFKYEFSPDSLWLATSGTTSGKAGSLVVLSHEALEVSARAVNAHLQVSSQDRWGLALPLFHIGGLMILIRAALMGSGVSRFDESWDVRRFHRWLGDARVTLLSLVPTQVFDLVEAGLTAPHGLRAVIVGGARLEPELFLRARELGWPLLVSYGLTECGSQVATGSFAEPGVLRPLSHVEVRSVDGVLELRSHALMTAKLDLAGAVTRMGEGEWFQTSDRGKVIDVGGQPALQIQGRVGDVVKILGELVDVARLNGVLHALLPEASRVRLGRKLKLKTESDLRTGASLTLIYGKELGLSESEVDGLVSRYNELVAPFERVSSRREVDTAAFQTWKDPRVDRYS
ncbi:MAG: AMP-binding protein [Bdellovibrionales bacterium]|nr:AMP-binding protein [Bdellovibrionales bacterium]